MERIADQFIDFLAANLPRLVTALLIFIVGWIVAYLISATVRALLKRTNLDNRLLRMASGDGPQPNINVENTISKTVFYFILLMVVVATLQALRIQGVTEPLNNFISSVLQFIPKLFGAGALFFLAWVVARLVKSLLKSVLQTFNLDEKVRPKNIAAKVKGDTTPEMESANAIGSTSSTLTNAIANTAYWLVFLFFLPIILDVLNLNGILTPITGMLNKIIGSIPNLFAAGLLLAIAYFVSRVVAELISSILTGIG